MSRTRVRFSAAAPFTAPPKTAQPRRRGPSNPRTWPWLLLSGTLPHGHGKLLVRGANENYADGWARGRRRPAGSGAGIPEAIGEDAGACQFLRIVRSPEVRPVLSDGCRRRSVPTVGPGSAGCRSFRRGSVRGSDGAGSRPQAGIVNRRRGRPHVQPSGERSKHHAASGGQAPKPARSAGGTERIRRIRVSGLPVHFGRGD